MMNRFEKMFGSPDNITILMGDFSRKTSMKYCEPTKGKSIRKLFKDRGYRLYLVNEYNTSCKLYETGEELAKIRKDKDSRYVLGLLVVPEGAIDQKSSSDPRQERIWAYLKIRSLSN